MQTPHKQVIDYDKQRSTYFTIHTEYGNIFFMSPEFAAHESAPLEPEKQLYPYQQDMLKAIQDARSSGMEGAYIDVATGCGKDFTIAREVRDFFQEYPDKRMLYLCHNKFILEQASSEITKVTGDMEHGKMFGGEFQDQEQIVFATFQTMGRKLGGGRTYEAYDPEEFDYVIVNESHHGPAPTYREVIDYFQPDFKLGATATPDRRDEQDIGDIFGPPIYTLKLEEAIAKGYLAKPDYHVLTDQVKQLDDIADRPQGVSRKDIEEMNGMVIVPKRDEEIVGTITKHLERIDDPRTLVFCASIGHTEHFSRLMPGESATLHSELADDEKDKRLAGFRSGEIPTLLVVDMLNEGVDVPEINTVVFLRSTDSKAVFFQQLGRGLRKVPGKDQITVLDFVANWDRLSTLQNLQDNVKSHRRKHKAEPRQSREVDADISFNFSSDAMKAVSIIHEARNRERQIQTKPKETPRLDKWAVEEAEVKAMLGIDELPPQTISSNEWEHYSERIASGDKEAVLELVTRHLRFAYSKATYWAERLDTKKLTIEDLFQNAIVCVHEGIKGYDPSKSTTLKHRIVWSNMSMPRYIQDEGPIRLPNDIREKFNALQQAKKKIIKNIGDAALDIDISDTVLSEVSDMDPATLAKLRQIRETMDYDSLLPIEAAHQVVDSSDMTEEVSLNVQKEHLKETLEYLSPRERRVLELIYGLGSEGPRTTREVGQEFGVAPSRVTQVLNQAFKKLVKWPETQALREPKDIKKHQTPSQRQKQHQASMRKADRHNLQTIAAKMFEPKLHSREMFKTIYEEEGPAIGSLCRLIIHNNTFQRNSLIDKHDLAKNLEYHYLPKDQRISHVDYIRALTVLEKHGAVQLQRNNRGTVIESVTLNPR
jgi:RNA polymerase sigma factor (sigma-70 family)